jgi:hypothetical protein
MTELSRSLLAAAREGLAPDDAIAARVRAKVAAAVAPAAASAIASGDAAAASATATATTTTATAITSATAPSVAAPSAKATASSLPLGKLALALVVVAAASTAFVVVRSERAPAAVPLGELPLQVADEPPADVRVAAPNDPLVLPDAPRARAKQAPTVEAPSSPTRSAASREPASLSREVELIDLAMVSLRKNAPLAAIEAIRVFERETLGRGQMAEDAAAIEIEARCVLGGDVTTALARFDRRWPESAQRERIQRTCFAK